MDERESDREIERKREIYGDQNDNRKKQRVKEGKMQIERKADEIYWRTKRNRDRE